MGHKPSLTASSTSFTATGYAQLNLNCTSPVLQPSYGNPTVNISLYSCTAPTKEIPGYQDPAPDLPHSNYNHSCTVNSFNLTSLELTYFIRSGQWALEQYDSPEVLTEYMVIQVYNPAADDTYHIIGSYWLDGVNDKVNGSGWMECYYPSPRNLLGCQYMYDNATNTLGVRVQWFCDDRDPEHA